ncbi:MAG: hypothetical protein JW738_09945 [Actinobacteria bacterium]|nr:hypothetical protein [Actinomycetota bacterium]
MVSIHVPWHDEVQAWLLARDTNPISLLFQYLRYEGHPGLWHLILMAPAKLNFPLMTLNIISCVAMIAAAYLVIFKSRFPVIIKILLPFSYFFFYQYAVIARSYSLLAVLLFLIAIVYKQKTERPYAYFTLLILLANVSLHGTLIALSLLALHLGSLKKEWPRLPGRIRKGQIIGLSVFMLAMIILVLMLLPPADLRSPAKFDLSITRIIDVSFKALNTSLTTYWFISFPMLAVLLVWFYKRRLLLTYLVITVPLLLFFAVVYSIGWHYGIVFFVLVFVLWLSFDEQHQENERTFKFDKLMLKQIATVALTAILAIQIVYSYRSFIAEFHYKYSSTQSIATYIKEYNLENKKIYILGPFTAVLAYFDENIFDNYNDGHGPCFWLYSTKNNYIAELNEKNIKKAVREKPDYILVPSYPLQKDNLEVPGYVPEVIFYGNVIWMGEVGEMDSAILFKRE